MFDLLRKGMLLGLGFVTLTRERAEALADELIKKGELAREERAGAIDELIRRAEEEQTAFGQRITAGVEGAVTKLGLPTQKDLARLEEKIDELIKKVPN